MRTTTTLLGSVIRCGRTFGRLGALVLVLALFAAAFPGPQSQTAGASSPPALDRNAKARIIDWVGKMLNDIYVFPDVAAKCGALLRDKLAAGAYDAESDISAFARRLTADLREVAHDKHMSVQYAPKSSLREEPKDEAEKKRRLETLIYDWRLDNFLFKKVEHLEGNVGYLRFDRFVDARYAGGTAVAAMNFLGNCDAMIVDLRSNGGGNGTMVKLLLGYFFEEETNVCDLENRQEGKTYQAWTPAYVPGPRLDKVDLYVLTSRRTFSAAEEFAYDLQSLKRATIVGETTGGGGHTVSHKRNEDLKIEFSIPNARAINPVTKTGWEGRGVAPDVSCPADQALDKAYALALKALHDKAPQTGNKKAWLKGLLDYQEGIADPHPISEAEMKAYTGSYGPVRVLIEGGRLYVIQPNGSKSRLVFLGGDMFLAEGNKEMKIVFERGAAGEVTAVFSLDFDGTKGTRIPKERRSGGGILPGSGADMPA
jgi:hypothetical protein